MKLVLIFGSLFIAAVSNAQFSSGCFDEVKEQIDKDLKENEAKWQRNDTTREVYFSTSRINMLLGCKFPYSPLASYDKKEINPVNLKAEFTIINFNYTYCQVCLLQLDKLVAFKKASKKDIKIIALFREDVSDLKEVIEKYSADIFIAANAAKWIDAHCLGMGYPLNYILDKNKIIKYAVSGGGYDDTDAFSKTLAEIK
jgi:cytochrome oxidase Cu insertion factor (SCO1/SenC/PrrC family)